MGMSLWSVLRSRTVEVLPVASFGSSGFYDGVGQTLWEIAAAAFFVCAIFLRLLIGAYRLLAASREARIREGRHHTIPDAIPPNRAASALGALCRSPGSPEEPAHLAEVLALLSDPSERTYLFRLLYQRLDHLAAPVVARGLRERDPPVDIEGARRAFLDVAIALSNPNPALNDVFDQAFFAAPDRVIKAVASKLLEAALPPVNASTHAAALSWRQHAQVIIRLI